MGCNRQDDNENGSDFIQLDINFVLHYILPDIVTNIRLAFCSEKNMR